MTQVSIAESPTTVEIQSQPTRVSPVETKTEIQVSIDNSTIELFEESFDISVTATTNQLTPIEEIINVLSIGMQGPEGIQGAVGLNWRGQWDINAAYQQNDAVEFQGASYVAIIANTGASPSAGVSWDLLAQSGSADKKFTHVQNQADVTWAIAHNMGKNPTYIALDDVGNLLLGRPEYIDLNTLLIHFNSSKSGVVQLS